MRLRAGYLVTLLAVLGTQHSGRAQLRDIAKVSQEYCAGCHGPNLEGGRGGALIGSLERGDDDSIATSIRDGSPQTGMPAFGRALDEAEVQALVVYIRE